MFSNSTWGKIFFSLGNGSGGGGVLAPPLPPFLYGPARVPKEQQAEK